MLKFLRKYNKWLIALFGAFLMVTWLLTGPGGLLQNDPLKQTVATLGERKVRRGEIVRALAEYNALRVAAPTVLRGIGVEHELHWMLLAEEASKLKLVGNAKDGFLWLDELARVMVPDVLAQQILQEEEQRSRGSGELLLRNPQLLNFYVQLRQRQMTSAQADQLAGDIKTTLVQPQLERASIDYRLSEDQANLALAKLRGVSRLVAGHDQAARLSDKRLVTVARRLYDSVQADGVVLTAEMFSDNPAPIPEEQLLEHFEVYRTAEPGTGEYGFSYIQPQRVRLEWLRLSRASIASAVTVDPIEANKHWRLNRSEFPGEFAAERERVMQVLKDRRVEEVLAEADRAFKARLKADTRQLEVEQGVRKLPPDWDQKRPSMAAMGSAMVEGVRVASGLSIPAPAVESRSESWVTLAQLSALPDIGLARASTGGRSVTLADLAAQVHELRAESTLGLQAGVPFEGSLADTQGDRYYFTVLTAKERGPADTLEEVRDQVTRDVRSLRAYETVKGRLDAYRGVAESAGLDALVTMIKSEADAAATLSVQRGLRFNWAQSDTRVPGDADGVLRDLVMQRAENLGFLTPATPENQVQRTVAAALPKGRVLAIVQIVGATPITREDLRGLNSRVADSLAREELRKLVSPSENPFSYDLLKARLRYVPRSREDDVEKKPDSQAAK